jgi:hypothetical protein
VKRPVVLELHHVEAILVAEVALQPLNPKAVSDMAELDEHVTPATRHIGGIEQRLVLGDHIVFAALVFVVMGAVIEARFRRGAPASAALEVALHQLPIGEELEIARAHRHRCLKDFIAKDDQQVARIGLAIATGRCPFRRAEGFVMPNLLGPAHRHAFHFKQAHEAVELLLRDCITFRRHEPSTHRLVIKLARPHVLGRFHCAQANFPRQNRRSVQ